MNNTNGATLEAVRRERAARANSETPATDRTRVLNSLARSAPVRSLARACSFAAFGVLLVALGLVATATLPSLFGYHTYTIDGGSMEPTLSVGDAAVTKPSSPRSLEVGDVIVRRDTRGGQPVLHRIVEIVSVDGQLAFITQGDKNNAPDVQPVVLAGTGDKVIYSVPYAGYLLNFAGSWPGRFILIGLPFMLLAGTFAKEIQRAIRPERRAPGVSVADPEESAAPIAVPDVGRVANQLNSWALRRFVLRHSGGYRRLRQCASAASQTCFDTAWH
ncbi:MAG: signal peptidase I [Chloroflexi bacterium]|nr:signal peptidase I [Chloroflexota bacterium]